MGNAIENRFARGAKRLIADLVFIAVASVVLWWAIDLLRAGDSRGRPLATIALVITFQGGKFLGARRGSANI
jgi:hypothetical protein